jgi:Family of unknown function (DUF6314)
MIETVLPLEAETLTAVEDLAIYLCGNWNIERTLVDHHARQRGHFSGQAEICALEPNLLVYIEQGELVFGDYRGPARRSYRYLVTGPGQATVHFDDGRHFFDLDLRGGRCGARHRCGDDTYLGLYLVGGANRLETRWRVLGPKRALVLHTTAQRRD